MTKFIPLFLVLAASLAFSGSNARASDFGVSVGIGNGGYYSPYYDDGYVTYYDNSGYYPYSYDDYGYYYPSYNWNTNVGWYGSWYGNHDRDRDYWRGSYGNNYRYNNTYRNTNNYTGYSESVLRALPQGFVQRASIAGLRSARARICAVASTFRHIAPRLLRALGAKHANPLAVHLRIYNSPTTQP